MDYQSHFHFHRPPFTLTPNSDLFFPDQHLEILEAVVYAIQRGEGIIKVTGEVGTGKTMLCRLLVGSLVSKWKVAYLTAPQSNPKAMAKYVCREFEAQVIDNDPFQSLQSFLLDCKDNNQRAILIVDEAQGLGPDGLEAIRLLSNLETEDQKLLQIILFGQFELNHLLSSYGLRQLNQRISFAFDTSPFDRTHAIKYILHRLINSIDHDVAYNVIAPKALLSLATHSRGVPRLINILADKAFLEAYAEGKNVVQEKHVLKAVRDTAEQAIPLSLKERIKLSFSIR